MYEIKQKIAVITGGAMGIGFATAKRLLEAGAKVVLLDYNAKALDNAVQELSKLGEVHGFTCDVTDKARVYSLAKEIAAEIGPVSILVNNAGTVVGGDLLQGSDEDWERTIAINMTAPVYLIRAFLPSMYERNDGRVVNIASAAGLLGVPNLAVYCATKWGIWGLTESLRFEALNRGKKGVKFSSVHPSYIATGLFEGAKLGFLGNLVAPLLKSHDVIAEAIVESAIKRGRHSPKRPCTVNLLARLRGLLPDFLLQRVLIVMGIPQSMQNWTGREGGKH
jgi:all-trans-retinol dehydrogenase (NAD+)